VLGSLGLLDFLALLAASEIRIREVSFAMCSAPESQPSALASDQQWSWVSQIRQLPKGYFCSRTFLTSLTKWYQGTVLHQDEIGLLNTSRSSYGPKADVDKWI